MAAVARAVVVVAVGEVERELGSGGKDLGCVNCWRRC